jgi:hypothetical protein
VLHYPPASVDSRIRQAIAGKNLVEVGYKGRLRVVEPHDYGSRHGVEWLLVYQLTTPGSDGSHAAGWRLFEIDKIQSLSVLDARFQGSRRVEGQNHHTWDILFARVTG